MRTVIRAVFLLLVSCKRCACISFDGFGNRQSCGGSGVLGGAMLLPRALASVIEDSRTKSKKDAKADRAPTKYTI